MNDNNKPQEKSENIAQEQINAPVANKNGTLNTSNYLLMAAIIALMAVAIVNQPHNLQATEIKALEKRKTQLAAEMAHADNVYNIRRDGLLIHTVPPIYILQGAYFANEHDRDIASNALMFAYASHYTDVKNTHAQKQDSLATLYRNTENRLNSIKARKHIKQK